MIIVNTTFYVENRVEQQFLKWLSEGFVPCCSLSDVTVARILTAVEAGMAAYAVRMKAVDAKLATDWTDEKAPLLLQSLAECFGQSVLHFTTLMESVEI
ncbi:MAG: DUF4286 family protein [Duncaniella sp.]|nr:DUF4286 family protein [Duncaniella sp.]